MYRGRWRELWTNVVKYTLKLGKVLRNSSKITSQNDLSEHQKSSIRLPRFVPSWFLFHGMVRNGIPRVYLYYLLHGKEFRVVFSSAEWFGTEFREFASILVSRTEFRVVFSSAKWVQNRIMGVCFNFFSTERNS